MKKPLSLVLALVLVFILYMSAIGPEIFSAKAQTSDPLEDEGKLILFKIARSDNDRVIYYKANLLPNGGFNPAKPIDAFKIDYNQEEQERTTVPELEWNVAYGYDILQKKGNNYVIRLKAFTEREIDIYYSKEKCFALTSINNKIAQLQMIHIKIIEDMFTPKVEFVKFLGIELKTGRTIFEIVTPENLN
jgi:hypothetical protein